MRAGRQARHASRGGGWPAVVSDARLLRGRGSLVRADAGAAVKPNVYWRVVQKCPVVKRVLQTREKGRTTRLACKFTDAGRPRPTPAGRAGAPAGRAGAGPRGARSREPSPRPLKRLKPKDADNYELLPRPVQTPGTLHGSPANPAPRARQAPPPHCLHDPGPTLPRPLPLQSRPAVGQAGWGWGMHSLRLSWERSCVGRGGASSPGPPRKAGNGGEPFPSTRKTDLGPGYRAAMERTRPQARGCGQILGAEALTLGPQAGSQGRETDR